MGLSEDIYLNSLIRVLKQEDVRMIDGRWSNGFVDIDALSALIDQGRAEVYYNQGFIFVRLKAHGGEKES
jgi:hypothetical protein